MIIVSVVCEYVLSSCCVHLKATSSFRTVCDLTYLLTHPCSLRLLLCFLLLQQRGDDGHVREQKRFFLGTAAVELWRCVWSNVERGRHSECCDAAARGKDDQADPPTRPDLEHRHHTQWQHGRRCREPKSRIFLGRS